MTDKKKERRVEEFTEQDQVNLEAEATRAAFEAEQEAEAKAEEQRQKAQKKAKTLTGRMQEDRRNR